MSAAGVLRACGWVDCGECEGTGGLPCSFCDGSEPLDGEHITDPTCQMIPCLDCVDGVVPSDEILTAIRRIVPVRPKLLSEGLIAAARIIEEEGSR